MKVKKGRPRNSFLESLKKSEVDDWGKLGKPYRVVEIEKTIRKELLTGSIDIEKIARKIYFL